MHVNQILSLNRAVHLDAEVNIGFYMASVSNTI